MSNAAIRSFAAAMLVVLMQPSAYAAQSGRAGSDASRDQIQQQQQGPRQGPGQGRGPRAGGPPEAVRRAVLQRMRDQLDLPDSQIAKLSQPFFRYRDSLFVLEDRERFIRGQLRSETDQGRTVNEDRVGCLIGELFATQRMRVDMLSSEDKEISAMLTPSKRLRYLALQENFNQLIERAMQGTNERRNGGPDGPRGQGRAGSPGGGRADGPPRGGGRGRGGPFAVCGPPSRGTK